MQDREHGSAQHRALLERLHKVIASGDIGQLTDALHPEFVQVIPQSGERIVGPENFRKIIEHYPGGTLSIQEDPYIAGDEEHYIVTPTFQVVRVADQGDELTSYVKATYPDGSEWYIISFTTFKDGKIIKRVDFFAPTFDAPDWRAEWVERG